MTQSKFFSLRKRFLIGIAALVLLQACATKPPVATDFGDNWKPLNVLPEVPVEQPLKEEVALHRFQSLPTDTSLRDMLERWAKENGGTLDWQYPGDLSVVAALEQASDNNLQRALNVVRRSYREQRLRVQVLPTRDLRVSRLP
jgi:hypothetical protein